MITGWHFRLISVPCLVVLMVMLMIGKSLLAQVGTAKPDKAQNNIGTTAFTQGTDMGVEEGGSIPGNAGEIRTQRPDAQTARQAREGAQQAIRNSQTKQTSDRARTAADNGTAQGAAGKARHSAELRQLLGLSEEAGAEKAKGETGPPPSPQIVLFASASMPLHVLRAYAAQLDKAGGAIVFRGSQGGVSKIYPFAKMARNILLRDESCKGADCAMYNVSILIDPILFRANAISRVPASIILERDLFAQHCDDPEGVMARGVTIIYGDASLSGMLEAHQRSGDRRAFQISKAIGG
jgi:type-F conjugative transfer system pilin assembly protein TrbC